MTMAAPAMPASRFDEVSSVAIVEEGRFSADIDPEWTIGG
jgi:hypothetical protein